MKNGETVNCIHCGRPFQRFSTRKRMCGDPRCLKLRKLGYDKPVTFKGISSDCSEYRADLDYHGKPYL